MFGLNYTVITVVAIIRKIDYTSTKITYTLEDHTGKIDAHFWLEEENAKQPALTQNAYARVIGALRTAGDNKVIIIYHAEEITKIGDVSTHLLEILFSRFQAEAFQKKGVVKPSFSQLANNNETVAMDTAESKPDLETTNPHLLTGVSLAVYQAIQAYGKEGGTLGLERRVLQNKFSKISAQELETILGHMCTEGMIYSTVDTDHFLTVD